ncbi:tetratricopeptide repeat protein [Streptomyces sp. 7N604]|uniref:tetratricopeptide repeat protein n=1 Tax=Streptomyces sp. 7N604 TaxID=3457415 RepID=UPI003FD10158
MAMFNRRAENELNLTAPLPAPRFIAWWAWTGVGTAGLLGLLAWAGEDHRAWGDTSWDDWMWPPVQNLIGWLGQVCGGLGRVFKESEGLPIGQRMAFIAYILLLLYVYWRATRAWVAYKPGPVDVQKLEDATPTDLVSPPIDDLTAEFRRHLSESSMYAPTTLPAQAPETSFLELLGDIEIEPNKLGTILPRLLSRLRPKLAYRVGGVLRVREEEPDRLGVTVTVTAYVFGGSRAMTVWASDWDEVIHKAGCWVVSTLLPVTRAGRRPPWRPWWGRELKPELYEAYQKAVWYGRAGRYHEALARYYEAIRLDPVNPYLRAELAEVQEKLHLHIDALDTCQRALSLDGQTAHHYNKRLWERCWKPSPRRLRYLIHPRRFRQTLGLRYRNSIILGTSDVTAKQWCNQGSSSSRTRKALIPVLEDRYWQTAVGLPKIEPRGHFARISEDDERGARERIRSALREQAEAEVRLIFQRASAQETQRLAADDRRARVFGLYWIDSLWSRIRFLWPSAYVQSVRGAQQSLTQGAFRVNQKVWGPLRLATATASIDDEAAAPESWRRPYAWRTGPVIKQKDMKVADLDHWIGRARRRLFIWPRRDWLTYYNSACVYAVAMDPGFTFRDGSEDNKGDSKNGLIERAVRRLEKAVLVPRGGFTTVERTWLVKEDPDLAPLRGEERFKSFARTAYPRPHVSDQTPPIDWTAGQKRDYDYRLLEKTAKVMEQVWLRRSANAADNDVRSAATWLRAESELWQWTQKIAAADRIRQWRDRVELVRSVQVISDPAVCATSGFPPPMLPDGAGRDGRESSEDHSKVLARLEEHTRTGSDLCSRNEEWIDMLTEAAADGVGSLETKNVRELSIRYAAIWQTLCDWLARQAPHGKGEDAFLKALDLIPEPGRKSGSVPRGRKKLLM